MREFRDAEKDARVEEMVEECVIQLQTPRGELVSEADSSNWKAPGALAQRGMRKRAGTVDPTPPQNLFEHPRRPTPPATSSNEHETLPR